MMRKKNPKIPLHDRLFKSLDHLSITSLQNQTELRNLIPVLRELLRHRQKSLPDLQELRLEAPTEGDPTVFGMPWLQQEADHALPEGVAGDLGMNGEFKWGHRFWQAPRLHTLQKGISPRHEEDTTMETKDENQD
ncbi:hypothetical protein N7508_001114 [Penicillium antarcticum]|uniref:uncharacterized protein n=1 Tax=Penicillium antarcticum TaxID=416450 RepID=UPI002382937A|nr:uncharacterized protein N7508_001114 [Penicillium antarcticum]KAJ5316606.1 hypothetical protein N7508_001114 [Penicillium antarcticum]